MKYSRINLISNKKNYFNMIKIIYDVPVGWDVFVIIKHR